MLVILGLKAAACRLKYMFMHHEPATDHTQLHQSTQCNTQRKTCCVTKTVVLYAAVPMLTR